jgi:copper chaperone NosL
MLISDDRYGAELITDKGKVYKFDSIECLINFALAKNVVGDEKCILLVNYFSNPGILNDARSSLYIHNDNYRSPMGLNVSAFGNDSDVQKFLTGNDGKKITWLDVIEMVRQHSM